MVRGNELRKELSSDSLDLIAIEIWGGKRPSLQNYAKRFNISYPVLEGSEEVIKDYLDGARGVPLYFILDQERIIKKSFTVMAKNRQTMK